MKAPKNIIDIIISNKTSLGDNPALPPELDEKFLVFLVNNHYNELSTHFDSINVEELSQDLSHTMTECSKIENGCKEALEKLCSDIVIDLFNIPSDTISIDMKIVDKVDTRQERLVPENSANFSFDSIEDMNNLTEEIYKRRLLNAITVGAAMYYSEQVDAYSKYLYKIDSRLPSMYKKIMCINDLLLFHTKHNISGKQKDGGRVDVFISDETTPVKIKAQGILFPILLEEAIKGLLELSISHGLPNNREKAEYIISKADFKLAEIWDQRLGLPLWKRIAHTMNEVGERPTEVGINFIFMELAQLKTNHFNSAMQEIFANTKAGQHIIKNLSHKIQYQKERDEFDNYMTLQQNNKFPINDEDFTSDELINDDLCSAIVLDETDLF